MSLTFGLYKVLVPEKMNLNGKSVNTLTKTHNPSKRKGEQSISLVSSSKNSKPEVKINVDTKTARSNIAKLSKAVMEREKKKVNQLDRDLAKQFQAIHSVNLSKQKSKKK